MTLTLEGPMKKTETVYRYQDTKSAKYLSKQLDAMADVRSQREISQAVGWSQPQMLSMLKRGEARIPLEKAPALARAINVDPGYFLRLVMQDYYEELYEAISQNLGAILSKNESALLDFVRETTNNADPALTDEMKEKLRVAMA